MRKHTVVGSRPIARVRPAIRSWWRLASSRSTAVASSGRPVAVARCAGRRPRSSGCRGCRSCRCGCCPVLAPGLRASVARRPSARQRRRAAAGATRPRALDGPQARHEPRRSTGAVAAVGEARPCSRHGIHEPVGRALRRDAGASHPPARAFGAQTTNLDVGEPPPRRGSAQPSLGTVFLRRRGGCPRSRGSKPIVFRRVVAGLDE